MTSSDVDDSAMDKPEPTSGSPTKESTEAHIPSGPNQNTNAAITEDEPDMLLGFMNDGAADIHQFGLDGEGPGPAEQRAWSWNIPHPSLAGGQGPYNPYMPGQPPPSQPPPAQSLPAQTQPSGSYSHAPAYSLPWQQGHTTNQNPPNGQRPQRRVHFNDQIPQQPPGYGASNQSYNEHTFAANTGQPQEQGHGPQSGTQTHAPQPGSQAYPNQPGSHVFPPQPGSQAHPPPPQLGSHGFPPQQGSQANPLQTGSHVYPPQPGNHVVPPQNEPYHQPPSQVPVTNNYANPPWQYIEVASAQDQGRDFYHGADWNHQVPTPSYQPVGYGVPGYAGWYPPAQYPAYAQPVWPGQSFPGPSYFTPPNLATTFPPSYPYPYHQSAYTGGPVAPVHPPAKTHLGGGIWGPPPSKPGSQDPAKDENNQMDGQSNQNQDSTSNSNGQQNENNTQDDGKGDTNTTQAGDQGWSGNDSGGGQTENWSSNAAGGAQTESWKTTETQTQAPTNDWTQTASNTGETNNPEPAWNATPDNTTQVRDSWNPNNTSATIQPNEATFTFPQQAPSTGPIAQPRHLYGPYGPYFGTFNASVDGELLADAAEEPPYDVPPGMPTTHQVKAGQGYMYAHKRRSPEYLDTLEEPYARFVFKYRTKGESSRSLEPPIFLLPQPRSKKHPTCCSSRCSRSCIHDCGTPTEDEYWPIYDEDTDCACWSEADATSYAEQVENETGIKIDDEPTGDDEKLGLQKMSKDEIIDMLLRAKVCRFTSFSYLDMS
jgi:hypothetical protein